MPDPAIDRMREDWDRRAREDARYWVAFERKNQPDDEFVRSAASVVARVRRDYPYLTGNPKRWRFLEIGCGPGRLMRTLAADCGEIHGVDISPEMCERGRRELAHIPHAHFHVAANNDLAMFADSSFDLVYSFAVFQHIPERRLVFRYLDETARVLRAGGIFIAQFNASPRASEAFDSWSGVWNHEPELRAWAEQRRLHILASEGAATRYLWMTFRRPRFTLWPEPSSIELIEARMTARGIATIQAARLSEEHANIAALTVRVGGVAAPILCIAPLRAGKPRDLSIAVPPALPSGRQPVTAEWRGRGVSNALELTIEPPPPLEPKLESIVDGVEYALGTRIKSRIIHVRLQGCREIATFRATLNGRAAPVSEVVCEDPFRQYYLVAVPAPAGVAGRCSMTVEVDGRVLGGAEVEIASPGTS